MREWGRATADAVRATTLGQKLLQLVLPGVPDIYQGCESLSLTLVDPDNRQPVDHAALADAAGRTWTPSRTRPATTSTWPGPSCWSPSRTLRLRRDHPEWFIGPEATYAPVATTSGSALALSRGDAEARPASRS